MLKVIRIYCPVIKCVDATTSECETIRLRADLGETTFTETVRTDLSVMEGEFAAGAGVGFFLGECEIESEKDDEGDADR